MLDSRRDIGRKRRQKRVRKKVSGTDQRPRLCVFRSLKHIYAQVISDETGTTMASVSTLSGELKGKLKKTKGVEAAKQVGALLAKICKEKNINSVVFDRNGFLYHGRVKAVAEAAQEGGLKFQGISIQRSAVS
ncbi:MAG: 50S ribosomal protein L18 [Candidatus Binatia bacterium]